MTKISNSDNNEYECSDTDDDTCDDCSSGTYDPSDDGLDTDGGLILVDGNIKNIFHAAEIYEGLS